MEYRDYYATLGVPRTATQAEIKKAFRKLARQHHPDVNKGDAAAEKRFKEVSEANEVLSDPEKRKLYDQLGANWQSYQGAGAGSGQPGNPFADFQGFGAGGPGIRYEYRGNAEDLTGFSDFFRTFFGGGGAFGSAASAFGGGAGAFGGGGTGSRPQTRVRTGSIEDLLAGLGDDTLAGDARGGSSRGASRSRLEAEAEITLEEVAGGTKRLLDLEGRRIEVNIPAGVADGQRIRFSGVAPDGGDVYLRVKVRPHGLFTRKDNNLQSEVPVTLREALMGAEVRVPTLGGRVLLRIPPETQNGRTFRLAGKGLPKFRGEGRGDLYVKVRVVLPTGLSDEAKKAAEKFLDLVAQPDPR
jgi:DnaJ-class molecular chaperone